MAKSWQTQLGVGEAGATPRDSGGQPGAVRGSEAHVQSQWVQALSPATLGGHGAEGESWMEVEPLPQNPSRVGLTLKLCRKLISRDSTAPLPPAPKLPWGPQPAH